MNSHAAGAHASRKNRVRTSLFAATTLVTVLTLGACSSAGSITSGESDGGGSLSFAIGNDPLVFNPAAPGNGNDTWYVSRQIFESLVYQNPDTGEADPWLAESYEINEDATEYTFKLREDVTFSDGTALTAETVKQNFDDLKAAGAASSAVADVRNYTETEVVDEYTAIIKFSEPNAAFLAAAAGPTLAIVSEPSLEIPFADRASGEGVSGSGPFTLSEYTKDSSVILKKREGYAWAPASFENRGDAHVDTVEFKVVPESGNRTGGLSSGQVDVAGGIAPNDIATVEASNNIVSRPNPGTVFGLYFNYDKPLFEDPLVREAVALAVDSEEIRDGALSDHFAVATSPLAATTKDYADVSDAIPTHNLEEAKQLLDEAGWAEGADGIREKDGEKLSFRITYINNFGPNADAIALLQEQLRAVGIESTQRNGTVPEFQANLSSDEFEIAWRNLSGVDADILRRDFTDVGSDTNFPFADEEVTAGLKEQATIGDEAERSARLAELQRDIVEKDLFVPVHELTTVLGVAAGVEGISLGADSRLDLLVDVQLND